MTWNNTKQSRLEQLLALKQTGKMSPREQNELARLKTTREVYQRRQRLASDAHHGREEGMALHSFLHAVQSEKEDLAALLHKIEQTRDK